MNSLQLRRFGIMFILALLVLGLNTTLITAQDESTPTDVPTEQPAEIPTETTVEVPTEVPTEVVAPTEIPVEPTVELPTLEATSTPNDIPSTDIPAEEPTLLPTVTTAPVILPEPAMRLLVRDLLDNGDLSHWSFTPGWSLVPSELGFALQSSGLEPAKLNKGTFYNVAAQMRFALTGGTAHLSLRVSAAGSYTVTLDPSGVLMLFRGDALMGSAIVVPTTPGAWRTLRLSAINDTLRVAVDDVELIVAQDFSPLPDGEVEIALGSAGVTAEGTPIIAPMLADDFFLFVPEAEYNLYPQPTSVPLPATPVPPTEIPPTVVPTVEVIVPTEIPTEVPVVTEVPPTPEPTEAVTPEPTAEITAEPTVEITVEATAEPTVEVTAEPTADVSETVKGSGDVAPPSEEQLLQAQASGNNNFSNAVTISGSFSVTPPSNTDSGDTTTATLEASEQLPTCGMNVGRTVWFNFTPSIAGTYTISLLGSNFDTVLGVYTGAAVNSLAQVVCNDDASGTVTHSSVNLVIGAGQVGTTYRIQIGGYRGAFGNYTITITRSGVLALAAPALVSPANAAGVTDTTPTLSWNAVLNASGYEIQHSTSATFTTGVVTSVVNTTNFTPGSALTVGTQYYWRVRTINANGVRGAFSIVRNFLVRTAPPTLNTPADSLVTTLVRPAFSWTAYPGATRYSLWLDATDNNCAAADPNVTFDYQTAATSFNLALAVPANFLSHGKDYFWCVAARDTQNNWTAYSPFRTFTVNLMNAPANNAVIVGTTALARRPTFSWISAGVAGAKYQLEVSSAPDFTNDPGGTGPVIVNNSGSDDYYFRSAALTTLSLQLPVGAELFDRVNFYWRLMVSTDGGTTFLPAVPPTRAFKVTSPAPVAPVLVTPTTGSVSYLDSLALDWNATTTVVGGPFTYELQLATNVAFTANLQTLFIGPDTDTTTPVLTDATYYWRVRTINAVGVAGPFSTSRTFIVRTAVPALNLPADGATVNLARPTLSWLAYTGAKRYEVEFSQDNTFTGVVPVSVNAPALSTIPAASLKQGTWYWRVRAFDFANVPSPYSVTRSFVVNIQNMPANNAVITLVGAATNANVTFSWTAVTGATGYIVRYASNNTFTTAVNTLPSVTTLSTVASLPAGVYFWQVQAVGIDTTFPPVPLISRKFTISNTAPAAPALVAPAAGAVSYLDSLALDWNATTTVAGGPFNYELQLATNATFTANLQTLFIGPDTDTTTPVLTDATYYWRVRTINAVGVAGPFSTSRTFIVRTAVPALNLPADGATVNLARPTLSWLAYTGAKRYEVEFSQDNTFTGVVPVSVNAPALSTIPAASLKQGTWYWRVRAFDFANVPSPYSVTRSFVVNIQNMPANNAVITLVGAATNANVTFSWTAVTGATGYIVRYASNNTFTTAVNTLPSVTTLSTVASLPAGVYFWQVQAVGIDTTFPPVPLISRKLTITNAAPVAPVLLTLPNNNITPDSTPTFTWNASTSTAGTPFTYEIQVDTTNTFVLPLIYGNASVAGLTDTVSPALTNGVYYWRVRTINQFGVAGPFSTAFKFTVDTTAPTAPPTPTAPINGITVTNAKPTFTWVATAGMGFVKYDLSYSNSNPPSDTPTVANLTTTSYIPTSPLLVTTYYWKVRGYDAAGNVSAWSDVKSFKVGSPTGAAPIPNRFTTNTPTLSWGPVSWAQSGGTYQIQVANNTTFTGTLLFSATLNPIAGNVPQTATVSPALADGTYYWRVRACYPAPSTTCGAWSSTGVFTVETAS